MDIGWIQVFVLTISECVAPAGKTVCQEREFELQFLSQADCEVALEQLVSLKNESESVIVNADKSSCVPSARQRQVYASLDEINESFQQEEGWRAPDVEQAEPPQSAAAHKERLESLPTCDESDGVKPCRVGDIIVEDSAEKKIEVWRRDQ